MYIVKEVPTNPLKLINDLTDRNKKLLADKLAELTGKPWKFTQPIYMDKHERAAFILEVATQDMPEASGPEWETNAKHHGLYLKAEHPRGANWRKDTSRMVYTCYQVDLAKLMTARPEDIFPQTHKSQPKP